MREARAEDLRAKIADGNLVTDILKTEEEVRAEARAEEPNNTRISAFRLLLDSKYRRLAKILPDLKAVEVSGPDGGAIDVVVNVIPHEAGDA